MDQDRLDRLARSLSGIASRREALRVVAASLLPAGAAVGMAPELDASKKKKKKKKKACSPACEGDLTCVGGTCICENGTVCGTRCCGAGQTCRDGACQGPCAPNCTDRVCGSDGCGGSCGTCPPGQACRGGECLSSCVPNCFQKACGPDGCGGTCGNCIADEICEEGRCKPVDGGGTAPPPGGGGGGGGGGSCVPNCAGKTCGADGCGGSCGSCGAGQTCVSGICNGVTYEFRRAIPAEPAFRYDPRDIAYAPNGDLFVLDSGTTPNRILRMTASGELVTQWQIAAEEEPNSYPYDIRMTVSSAGEVMVVRRYTGNSSQPCTRRAQRFTGTGVLISSWVWSPDESTVCYGDSEELALTDTGDLYRLHIGSIYHHSPDGVLVGAWGGYGASYEGLDFNPNGIAMGLDGNVLVYSQGSGEGAEIRRIIKFEQDGTYLASLDLATTRLFGNWYGLNTLHVDGFGAVYLVGNFPSNDECIWCKFSSTGELIRETSVSDYSGSMAVSGTGMVGLTLATNPSVIRFWSSTGQVTATWNTYADGPGEFEEPELVTIDDQGRVFVLERNVRRVQRFSEGGAYEMEWSVEPPGITDMSVSDLAWSPQRELLISGEGWISEGRWKSTILKYTSNGVYLGQVPIIGYLPFPRAVAVDVQGNKYVADSSSVTKFNAMGEELFNWGTYGETPGKFSYPEAIVADTNGTVLVLDTENERIQRFTSEGVFVHEWGVPGTGKGMFKYPLGMTVDADGFVYVVDSENGRVQKFTGDGEYVTRFGSFGTGNGQFTWPTGIAVHPNGKLYVVDRNDRRLKIFEPVSMPLSQLKARMRGSRKRNGARKG